MAAKFTTDVKTDPSTVKQHFTDISLKVHCCRYWKLSEWEFRNLSLPFWRLYANSIPGATVHFQNRSFELSDGKILLIPPYTSFSTSLKKGTGDRLCGNRIETVDEPENLKQMGMVDHLFIHFNLGFRYDHLYPGVFEFKADSVISEHINDLRFSMITEHRELSILQNLLICSLILLLVARIPEEAWKMKITDRRVLRVISYIEQNVQEPLVNDQLAGIANMAVNSFLRLFKASAGTTLQQFVQAKRIEKSVALMHNPALTIDRIACECGFSDRHHFSKVFKRVVNLSPGQYRNNQAM